MSKLGYYVPAIIIALFDFAMAGINVPYIMKGDILNMIAAAVCVALGISILVFAWMERDRDEI